MSQPYQEYPDYPNQDTEAGSVELAREIYPIRMGFGQTYTMDFDYRSPVNNDAIPNGGESLDPKDVTADAELALLTVEEVRGHGSHPSGSAAATATAPAGLKTPVIAPTVPASSTARTLTSVVTGLPPLPSSKKA